MTTRPEPARDLADWRREYTDRGLTPGDLGDDPIAAFQRWLADAAQAGMHEPNAMVVSTSGAQGPAARLVLLKAADERGFVFYTNYDSRKARELDAEPSCALLFPWHPLERQVRIEGNAARVSAAESDGYFATRPRPAQIGAWASPQSSVVPSREYLETSYAAQVARFAGLAQVPRPPHWGGIRVRPRMIEFWQGRPGRLHDRIRFTVEGVDGDETPADGVAAGRTWSAERLAP